jgi:hypothetical protein
MPPQEAPPRPAPAPPRSNVQSPAKPLTVAIHELVVKEIHPRLHELEAVLGHRVISLFLDEGAALADEQIFHLYEHLRRIGSQECIALWLVSRGGHTEVPWKIVSLIREFTKRFLVLVPYRAHSAATAVCLGADEIVMTEMSELGPVDPSRRHPLAPVAPRLDNATDGGQISMSTQDLRHVLKFLERVIGKDLPPEVAATVYTSLFDKVHPLAIGALEQSWELSRQISESLLATHMDREGQADEITRIVDRLSDYYKSHVYQINRREAKAMGLKVVDASPEVAGAMWELYLGYQQLELRGEAQIGNVKAQLKRLGHIDSVVGSSVGLGFARPDDPSKDLGTRWESKWLAAASVVPTAAPSPAQPEAA